MKKVFGLFILAALFLSSCGGGKQAVEGKEDFVRIEKELKSKFSENSYYTQFSVIGAGQSGSVVSVQVTKDPSSLKLEGWNYIQGSWKQQSEITLELSGGKPEDFMFSLSELNISKIGELVEASKKKVSEEKQINDLVIDVVSVNTPKRADKSETNITIFLKPKNGGTCFKFYYTMQGDLKSFDY